MNCITKKDMDELIKIDKYFINRWSYFKEVIDLIKEMDDVSTVLELGPQKAPLVENEDVMDITDIHKPYYPININNFIKWNCSKVPYPVKDKQYDLVIALQSLEHFGMFKEQQLIFKELQRISKKAIISLPYMWHAPLSRDHHMIDKKVIDTWTGNLKPVYETIKYEDENYKRIIRIYNFD